MPATCRCIGKGENRQDMAKNGKWRRPSCQPSIMASQRQLQAMPLFKNTGKEDFRIAGELHQTERKE